MTIEDIINEMFDVCSYNPEVAYPILQHPKFFNYYASKIEANKNDFVSANEKIGEAGSTGRSTGNHLHFEVIVEGRKIDPMECFEV